MPRKTKLLSAQEEIRLIVAAQQGDDRAREELIEKNMGLCWNWAHRCPRPNWLDVEDLAIQGVLGLHEAIKKFDLQRGCKFSTYASWWVRQAIYRHIQCNYYRLHVPPHLFEKIGRVQKCTQKLTLKLGRDPTNDEIIQDGGADTALLTVMEQISDPMISIEHPHGEDTSHALQDIVGDGTQFEEHIQREEWVSQVVESLPEDLKEIIQLRFGLGIDHPLTLREIAEMKGVSRERIRQYEVKALKLIRKRLEETHEESLESLREVLI